VTSRKKQQKNRRDSIKDWRFDVLPPERSLRQFATSVNPVWRLLSFTGKPELIVSRIKRFFDQFIEVKYTSVPYWRPWSDF
jgi:hypothetical protein